MSRVDWMEGTKFLWPINSFMDRCSGCHQSFLSSSDDSPQPSTLSMLSTCGHVVHTRCAPQVSSEVPCPVCKRPGMPIQLFFKLAPSSNTSVVLHDDADDAILLDGAEEQDGAYQDLSAFVHAQDNADGAVSFARAELQNLADEVADWEGQGGRWRAEAERLQDQVDRVRRDCRRVDTSILNLEGAIEDYHGKVMDLQAENAKLTEQLRSVQVACQPMRHQTRQLTVEHAKLQTRQHLQQLDPSEQDVVRPILDAMQSPRRTSNAFLYSERERPIVLRRLLGECQSQYRHWTQMTRRQRELTVDLERLRRQFKPSNH
jgi:hypothetical protein